MCNRIGLRIHESIVRHNARGRVFKARAIRRSTRWHALVKARGLIPSTCIMLRGLSVPLPSVGKKKYYR
jgi:hypothetical protein